MAEAIKPAVININTVSQGGGGGRTPFEEFFGEEFFRRFFGDVPERIPQRSLGSGSSSIPRGIALTNAHVVEKATEIEVITLDGSKHKAKLVGVDKKTDLAVLKLDDGKGKFAFARLGDSDRMQVGDWVIAVGSPFGLQATVTAGIISAKARQIGQGPFDDFLQTDAAINPGNSGGPLVNMQGEVIGINTAIVAGGSGIGFAIPLNMARKIYTRAARQGEGHAGLARRSIQPLTPELANRSAQRHQGRPRLGRLARTVRPARRGSRPATSCWSSRARRRRCRPTCSAPSGWPAPGQDSKVKVWRDQGEKTLEVKIGEAPDERAGPSRATDPWKLARPRPGRAADHAGDRPAAEPARRREGVMVARVDEDSPAAEAGVQRGDVIREINRQQIRSTADFETPHQARPRRATASPCCSSAARCRCTSPSRLARLGSEGASPPCSRGAPPRTPAAGRRAPRTALRPWLRCSARSCKPPLIASKSLGL